MVGKWGYASFTSIRNAPIISPGSESISRPKKFFKSKNTTSSNLDSEFEPIVQPSAVTTATAQPPAAPKAPSKFFKSKNPAPVQVQKPPPPVQKPVQKPVFTPKANPLRPLEVTPNQPLPPPPKDTKEVMKVPPLKLRLKAGNVTNIGIVFYIFMC